MPFLIDGHNLIGRMPGLRLDDPDDEAQLVFLLRRYLARTRKKGTVVFDQGRLGEQATLSNPRLNVRFARAPVTADDVLRELIRREPNPRGLIVVSSDARVREAARQAGADWRDASAFAREMLRAGSTSQQKESTLSAAEVEAWEKEFKAGRK